MKQCWTESVRIAVSERKTNLLKSLNDNGSKRWRTEVEEWYADMEKTGNDKARDEGTLTELSLEYEM